MHLYKSITNFLFDHNYFIDLWDKNIHVYGFVDIITLNDEQVSLLMENFKLNIRGKEFRVLKLTKNEILVTGKIEEMRFTI